MTLTPDPEPASVVAARQLAQEAVEFVTLRSRRRSERRTSSVAAVSLAESSAVPATHVTL